MKYLLVLLMGGMLFAAVGCHASAGVGDNGTDHEAGVKVETK